jgi:hypothetical protein
MSSCFKGSKARVEYQLQPRLDHAQLSIQPILGADFGGNSDRIEVIHPQLDKYMLPVLVDLC